MSASHRHARTIAVVLMLLGVLLALFGQLLLTTNRNIPIGFAVCGLLFIAGGGTLWLRGR